MFQTVVAIAGDLVPSARPIRKLPALAALFLAVASPLLSAQAAVAVQPPSDPATEPIMLSAPMRRSKNNLRNLLNSSGSSTFVSQSVVPSSKPGSASGSPPGTAPGAASSSSSSAGSTAAPGASGAAGTAEPAALSSVSGKVTNSATEQVLSDARVVLTMVGQEHKRYQTQSKEDGSYSFNNIEAGKYQITVSAKDMFSLDQYFDLKDGEAKALDVALEDVEPVDVLRLTGKRTLIHPEKIGSETNVDHPVIFQYKSGNDLRQLIESTPGVMSDSYGNMITRGEHNAVNYEIDGVVLPEAAGTLQQSQFVSPRSLQSMKVDIGGYEAQDGGGPLGAVAHLKSLPILSKPQLTVGQQIGGPLAGNIFYNATGALSQKDNFWNKIRFESSGSIRGSSYRLAPPVKYYVNNNGFDVNILSKLKYLATERDTFKVTAAINETYTQIPTSQFTRNAGFTGHQHDGQDYLIASYNHRFERFFDELDLHILNGIYYENFQTANKFDPTPNFNNGQPLESIAANAKRFNYVFSAQGNLTKNIAKTHHFKTGFLTELRPVHTFYNGTYYNADLLGSLQAQSNAQIQIAQDIATGNPAAAASVVTNPMPFGAIVSPFTGLPGGPQFQGNIGKYSGFRWLQSAYFQDKFTPQTGVWKRLTLDAGVRFDMQHSVFGNALPLAYAIMTVPSVQPFSLKPYETQRVTNAQASGRFGGAFVLAKNTVMRGSFSQLFMPNPVDYFLTPYLVGPAGVLTAGVYDGTPRPLNATRGYLVDTSIERQVSSRFVARTNLFYKYLTNFGDSGVVGNLPLYNRLTNSAQDAYGVETRMDMKPSREGYGINGFVSNTVQVAYLRGTRTPSGGFYDTPAPPFMIFPDHDRRMQTTAALGYRARNNFWFLFSAQVMTGLQDERDPLVYGAHPARTPVITNLSVSAGYKTPRRLMRRCKYLPTSFDVRVDNMLNQRIPVNLGSPFQGTRYSLPVRVLAGCQWQLGKDQSQLTNASSIN